MSKHLSLGSNLGNIIRQTELFAKVLCEGDRAEPKNIQDRLRFIGGFLVPSLLLISLRTVTHRLGSTLTFAFKCYQLQMLKKLSS